MKTTKIENLIRPHLANIKTYEPVDPPELLAKRAGIPEEQVIKLNGNENPYGGSRKATEVLAKTPLHIYPDPLQRNIRKGLSEYTGFDRDYIIAGAGSDELIDLLFRLFISGGDKILDCDPTFAMYGFCARVAGAEIEMVARDELFDIDVQAVRDAISPETKIIFISSPNNPTGNPVSEAQVQALLDTGLIVVVDEAYFEFCKQTAACLVPEHENLVVLRTLSKWAGLAGLRIGYGIMSPVLVNHIIDIKSPYNVNVAAEAALLASLEDAPALLHNVDLIARERERMYSLLEEIPGLTPLPSAGNFILCRFAPGRAIEVYQALAERGIFVRNFGAERLRDFFRISVGKPDQTDAVIGALKEIV
jgi:histidinol-phosphate aminotransferase